MFSENIIWYLFFAGVGSGASCVAFLLDSLARRIRPRLFALSRPIIAPSHFAGLALVALGTVFLVFDLGRIDRLLSLIITPSLSPLTFGSWALLLYVLTTAAQLIVRLRYAESCPRAIIIILRWLSALCAGALMLYTGLLLQSLEAVHFWATPLLPLLFTFSSLTGGVALILLIGLAKQADGISIKPLARLSNAHFPLLILELLTITAYLLLMLRTSPIAAASALQLISGDLLLFFWGGVVLCGLLLPVGIELLVRHKATSTLLAVNALVLLAGALAIRYCFLVVGTHPPISFLSSSAF
jgi:formate-dependent nitrite reductase membrane component NrfD